MKKIFILLIMIFMMPGMAVFATFDPYQPSEYIVISLYDNSHPYFTQEEPVLGHLDMLVKRDKVKERMLPQVSELFTESFGDSSNMDYLNPDEEWISYIAYVENAFMIKDSIINSEYTFANREDIIAFGSFKFVYIDESGQLICETEEITIISPSDIEWVEVNLRINIETGYHQVWTRYDAYVTTDWGDVIGALIAYMFRILLRIIGIILASALLLIGAFKLYEYYRKRQNF